MVYKVHSQIFFLELLGQTIIWPSFCASRIKKSDESMKIMIQMDEISYDPDLRLIHDVFLNEAALERPGLERHPTS